MAAAFPRRFRSRVFLAIVALGAVVFLVCCYSNLTVDVGATQSSGFFLRLWTTEDTCGDGSPAPAAAGALDTAEVYPTLDFAVRDNGGTGFWNEVLESRYREIRKTWKDLPLEVIVVPHSHVDPGWLRTYDDYSQNVVDSILDNMVEFLSKNEQFRFIWSEVSFLSSWWGRKGEKTRDNLKRLLQRKQLEIVTGGWVMTDEATTSYFAIIDQIVEGHQWLQHFTNTTPKRGWSVDVFGHSASVPYILSTSGITETVILRAHYSWKAYLAKNKGFDFFWEQQFPSSRIYCHMGPSDLYSFKHTCGPDQQSCLNYDFRKVGGEYSESTADEIVKKNIELKANHLISQYGRFASLFPHNVLLVPLGDDFRYNLYMEWNQQFENYQKIFDFINSKEDIHAHLRFGTVEDYFNVVKKRMENISHPPISIRGDFLPYGDIYANARPSYWTGFYTTRPFYKKLSHELEHWLRSSEILYSLTKAIAWKYARNILLKDYLLLISARQQLALFQHHDAITGTSKENVMVDYAKRLHTGIVDAMSVMSHLTQILFMKKTTKEDTWTSQIYPDNQKTFWNVPTKQFSLQVSHKGRKIIIFNSLTLERKEIVRVLIRSSNINVIDSDGRPIPSQINPTWKRAMAISNSVFELIFVAKMKPLSFNVFKLVEPLKPNSQTAEKAKISLFLKDDSVPPTKHSHFTMETPLDGDIILESPETRASFSPSGNLKEIYVKKLGIKQPIQIELKAYFPKDYKSGAYLFYPDNPNPFPLSNLTEHFPVIYVSRGPIVSELNVMYHNFLQFTTRLYHFDGAPAGVQLEISPDLGSLGKNIELIMRIKSDINNKDVFYTDSNGLQMLKRHFVPTLPIQGNYYPVTKAFFIEDDYQRLSFLVPYSHGSTSPEAGTMEIMLDRRMPNDDGRGVSEGVLDNKLFTTNYWLLLEKKTTSENPLLSPETNTLSLRLQYPTVTMITDSAKAKLSSSDFSFLTEPWPKNVHLVNLRTLQSPGNYSIPSNDSLLIVMEDNSCKTQSFMDKLIVQKNFTFSKVQIMKMDKTTLTGTTHMRSENAFVTRNPPKLQSCRITFR